MIQPVGVADHRVGHAAQVQQPVPVDVVARQPRDLQAEHQPGVPERDLGRQPREPRALRQPRAGDPEVLVDHDDLLAREPELDRALDERVLALRSTRRCAQAAPARTGARTRTPAGADARRSASSAHSPQLRSRRRARPAPQQNAARAPRSGADRAPARDQRPPARHAPSVVSGRPSRCSAAADPSRSHSAARRSVIADRLRRRLRDQRRQQRHRRLRCCSPTSSHNAAAGAGLSASSRRSCTIVLAAIIALGQDDTLEQRLQHPPRREQILQRAQRPRRRRPGRAPPGRSTPPGSSAWLPSGSTRISSSRAAAAHPPHQLKRAALPRVTRAARPAPSPGSHRGGQCVVSSFEAIPHAGLMAAVEERIVDRNAAEAASRDAARRE